MLCHTNPEALPNSTPDIQLEFFAGGKVATNNPQDVMVLPPGWYWWSISSRRIAIGDPIGPFDSRREALADAQGGEPLIYSLEEVA